MHHTAIGRSTRFGRNEKNRGVSKMKTPSIAPTDVAVCLSHFTNGSGSAICGKNNHPSTYPTTSARRGGKNPNRATAIAGQPQINRIERKFGLPTMGRHLKNEKRKP